MIKLRPSFNRARCYSGVKEDGNPYDFVKIPAVTPEGVSVSVNVQPIEWFAIASQYNLFDVIDLPVERVEVDPNGRTDTKGVPFKKAINPSWGEAEVLKKGFGAMPSYEELYKMSAVSRVSVDRPTVAKAEADM